MNVLTDIEKQIVKEIYPLLKEEKYQEAADIIGCKNAGTAFYESIGFSIINFLKANGIDILHEITKISYYLFAGSENLTEVVIPENIQYINDGAFSRCKALKSVIIPDSVKGIGEFAFNDCKLEEIKIPSSVQHIGPYAFDECDALETIYYDGTQEEWDAIDKDRYWSGSSNVEKVTCLRE